MPVAEGKLGERPIVTARGGPPSILSLHLADDGDEAAARSKENRQNDVLGGFARGFHHGLVIGPDGNAPWLTPGAEARVRILDESVIPTDAGHDKRRAILSASVVEFDSALLGYIEGGGLMFRGTKGAMRLHRAGYEVYNEIPGYTEGFRMPPVAINGRSARDGTIDHIQKGTRQCGRRTLCCRGGTTRHSTATAISSGSKPIHLRNDFRVVCHGAYLYPAAH